MTELMHPLHWMAQQFTSTTGILYGLLLLATMALFFTLKTRLYLFSVIALPGTLLHELMHLLVGILLVAEPVGFSIIPKKTTRGLTMGAVSFANVRWYNAFLIGAAPLLLWGLAALLVSWRISALQDGWHWPEIFWAYLATCMLEAGIPSVQDCKVMARSWLPLLLLILFGGWYWWRS